MNANKSTIPVKLSLALCLCRRAAMLSVITLWLLGTGCAERAIVFTTGTSIGIEATAEEGAEQRLVLGYKRFEGAFIPTRDKKGAFQDEAYSVYAAIGLDTRFFDVKIHQVFATGTAAQALAGAPEGLSTILTGEYNVASIPEQDRIAAWLGGPDSENRTLLRGWLKGRGIKGSEGHWVVNGQKKDLLAAIEAFEIPE